MLAVIPVRGGVLPAGADEAIAECGGDALVAGSATADADLDGIARHVVTVELGDVAFGRWAVALATLPDVATADVIVCPHSPDGRDLAPRLAAALDRPLYAGATMITAEAVQVARGGGRELHTHRPHGAFVATLQPGLRGADSYDAPPTRRAVELSIGGDAASDATVVELLSPDVRTMDLAESARIVGGGAGLDAPARIAQLESFAERIGATVGATRVVTDRGWVDHDRQIGTTGVVVDPTLYVAFGISGAVQHTAGLGMPKHIISVNTDPHCPMMAMADLAIVADANATLDELLGLLAGDADAVAAVGEAGRRGRGRGDDG